MRGSRAGRSGSRSAGRFGGGSLRRGVVVLVAAAVVLSACGSSSEESAPSPKQVGAQENSIIVPKGVQEDYATVSLAAAVTSAAVCYSWPNGTTDAQPCAVGLKGPGGGRVFYDAGSVQPWGRFLEVAPQAWGPDGLVDCAGFRSNTCGAADGVSKKTSDAGGNLNGYLTCKSKDIALFPGEAGVTGNAIGDGRRNTELLLQAAECTDGTKSAVTIAAGYRGGGLADWYLPSERELYELCRYGGRNAIGGFASKDYASSTTYEIPAKDTETTGNPAYTDSWNIEFGNAPTCPSKANATARYSSWNHNPSYVRPIRAFS